MLVHFILLIEHRARYCETMFGSLLNGIKEISVLYLMDELACPLSGGRRNGSKLKVISGYG